MTDKINQEDELFFTTHNPTASTTIVLLHGLFSCHLEWEHVIPYLEEYHLIVPDLPQHSGSKTVGPFSLALAADKVASLIERHAHNSRAHFVGLSLGGFVTMEVIRRRPQVVESAFVTGSSPFSGWQVWAAQRPTMLQWGLWIAMRGGIYRLAELQTGLKPHDKLKHEMMSNNEWQLVHDAYSDTAKWQQQAADEVASMDKRVLVVAGGHGDNLEMTKSLAETLKGKGQKDGKETQAMVVQDAIHGWNLQFPDLFAHGIKAWIHRDVLPERFEPLV